MGKSGKGSSFEREICKTLSLWWSDDQDDAIFWRTSGSGARATVRNKKNKKTFGQNGDIQATNPIGQPLIDLFSIELKRGYSSSSLMDILDKANTAKPQMFESFIQQAIQESNQSGAIHWLLITRRNQRRAVITFSPFLLTDLKKENIFFDEPFLSIDFVYEGKQIKTISIPFETFLNQVSKQNILSMIYYHKHE